MHGFGVAPRLGLARRGDGLLGLPETESSLAFSLHFHGLADVQPATEVVHGVLRPYSLPGRPADTESSTVAYSR